MKKLMLIVTSFLFVSTLQAMELPNKKKPNEHQDTTDDETKKFQEELHRKKIVKNVNFPGSREGGRITLTFPIVFCSSFSCEQLKNDDGIMHLKNLHAKACKNKFFLRVSHGTAVTHGRLDITQSPILLKPIDEKDPDFVAQCLPDEQGLFSQLEVQCYKNGSIMCDYLQPVIIQNNPQTELPKKYGMPCKNKGVLYVKTLYILIKPGETIEEVLGKNNKINEDPIPN